ncbi:MAG: 16S rRNA (adenine(1518)-N(6)/adenine(1519)-N(6))-dimethyltransferase RsmA [Ruminococcaceae bacterium]|nr:16S rRNA (adenine(1518)-N(6)/adenine(1519)-N(6))-dimethyltransferase RsmA [Oscillospiraceae bacterium]
MDNLTNILTIKNILSRHGFTFSKSLGQNFLINPSVCPRMAEFCGADKGVGVIEVGPGVGVLTHELCLRADKVVSIELDKRLLPVLDETLAEHDNIKVVSGDILKIDLKKLIEEEFEGMRVVVCANLPYYITSPVIMKLLEEKLPIDAITVMVQKEAAERICAKVGTRQSSAVTVAVNYYSEPQLLFHVSSGSFMPAPKVDSAVIRLDVSSQPRAKAKSEKTFFKVVKAAFAQRRKTVVNSIASGMGIEKSVISDILAQCGLSPTARAEQLTLDDFSKIADGIFERDD